MSLARYVNTESLIRDTLELVRIPSATGNSQQVAERYEQMLQEAGCDTTRYSFYPNNPTLLAVYETPAYKSSRSGGASSAGTPRTIVLNGHLDVIPLVHEEARVEDGRIYGRGSCDMKGSLACALEVVRIVREYGESLPVRLLVISNTLHESPGGRGEDLIELTRQVQLEADAGIVMEGATKEITVAQLGSATFEIVVRREGETSHQLWTPEGTPHPMTVAVDVLQTLERMNDDLKKTYIEDIGYASYFVGSVHCGKFYNQFPVTAELVGVRRYSPHDELEEIERELRGVLDDIAAKHGVAIELDLVKVRDGYRLPKQDPAIDALREAIRQVHGVEAPLVGKKTVTDAGILARALSGPVLCHGPEANTAHGDVEYVEIAELERAAQVYVRFIEQYVGG